MCQARPDTNDGWRVASCLRESLSEGMINFFNILSSCWLPVAFLSPGSRSPSAISSTPTNRGSQDVPRSREKKCGECWESFLDSKGGGAIHAMTSSRGLLVCNWQNSRSSPERTVNRLTLSGKSRNCIIFRKKFLRQSTSYRSRKDILTRAAMAI
jgi:hypothetical protein